MFDNKSLKITFQLGASEFNEGKNTKVVMGLACDFNIEQVALPDFSKCQGKIYGMKLADMAALTTLSFDPLLIDKRNLILIEAGSSPSLSTVFYGEIETAFADFTSSPDIALTISAMSGSWAMKLAAPATSVNGSSSVKSIIEKLADDAGYKLDCSVTEELSNVTFQGSVMQQIYAAARAVGAKVIIDNDILRVMAVKDSLKGPVTVVSKESGLIGYPSFNNLGVVFDMVYNPAVRQQSIIELRSIVPKATGNWRVLKLTHYLSAYNQNGGDWKTSVEAVYV